LTGAARLSRDAQQRRPIVDGRAIELIFDAC
jgi:hypothetical protein